ncbi:putative geranylgeranyl pyrophosphate synthetase [Rosellinia necatrix]|uniref:Putative geranylgeranyl pyrophosphate synthetase n=1 Tax=Rosellinia necatrix TaxID=77044 RepID=A0A1S8A4N1_ROSNE|nr:putative geranylgeranyl pyrophosphate synthetase [Rosellinia necatrix]
MSHWRGGKDRTPKLPDDKIPLGPLVTEFILEDIASSVGEARITNCKYAASYSMSDEKPLNVIIPGQPAAWRPIPLPCSLPGDRGDYMRDQNGARFPNHPIQPAVQALFVLNEAFDPSQIDIMGCASTLGDVLRFASAIESSFRFDVEVIGDTLFLIRNCKDEVIPDVKGYGHSFLDAFTSKGLGSGKIKSHQRVVSYDFAGLKCLVRFECDSYVTNHQGRDTHVTQPKFNPSPLPSDAIIIQKSGVIVPQYSVAEIKTKSEAIGEIQKSDHLPRLWVRQIPYFITAYHTRGTFQDVRVEDIREELFEWEAQHQGRLKRFATILRQLTTEVKRASHVKLEICRTGTGPLQLRERQGEANQALPSAWEIRWAAKPEPNAGPSSSRDDSDEDSDSYPLTRTSSGGSDGSAADFSFDYTACGTECGYCGRCA